MNYLGPLIAFIIAALLAFILISLTTEAESQVPPLQHSAYDKKLDRLDRRGVEAAYAARVGLLFQNWMTDTNKESKDRALRGHRNARNIYIEVMTGLDARDPDGSVLNETK